MSYVPPTVPNVCSYTTLANMNCQISTCLRSGTGFISTKLLMFWIETLHVSMNERGGHFEHVLFQLSSFVMCF